MIYNIYDARNTQLLVDKSVDIEASTARQALQRYLNGQGEGDIKFYNTSNFDVVWKTTPLKVIGDRKYQVGRISWWGIKPIKLN